MKTSYLLLSLLIIAGCREVKDPLPAQPEYFPMEVGKYIIYSYIEINHDPLQERSDTAVSLLRELAESTVNDAADGLNYKTLLEQSFDGGISWEFVKYVLHYDDEESAFRVEDNIRKSKLSFPLRERKFWDANHKNSLETQRARMVDLEKPATLGGVEYKNTITIDLGEDSDPFFQTKEMEIYAEGIGLVYREFKDLETQPNKYINGIEIFKTIQQTNWTP